MCGPCPRGTVRLHIFDHLTNPTTKIHPLWAILVVTGFTGNGFTCADIDECLVNNGGCSLSPRVECINTFVSFKLTFFLCEYL